LAGGTLIDVSSTAVELVRAGLDAWRQGEFTAIEQLLDPHVEWGWFEPGDWDCHNRADVMRTLRQRYDEGFGKGDLTFHDASKGTVIVVSHPSEVGGPEWPDETATVMTFRGDRIVSIQDYPTEADARAATQSS
jgi:ketosteroid isomerase-like protein